MTWLRWLLGRDRAQPPVSTPVPTPPVAAAGIVPAAAVDIVAHFEGLRLKAYLCPAGVWTIGYGSTRIKGRAVTERDRLRDEQDARALLADDLRDAERIVAAAVTVPLAGHELAAMISIVQNVGPGRADQPGRPGRSGIVVLRDGKPSTLLARLNAGAKTGAAEAFLSWTRGGGVELPGLVRRRRAERELFLGRDWRAAL